MKTNRALTVHYQGYTVQVAAGAEVGEIADGTGQPGYFVHRRQDCTAPGGDGPGSIFAHDFIHHYVWVPADAVAS